MALVGQGACAMARMTLDEALARPSAIDRVKLDATTEDDSRRYRVEDGYGDERDLGDAVETVSPSAIRRRLAMTQTEFAAALRIPVGTLRNWEQGRTAGGPLAPRCRLAGPSRRTGGASAGEARAGSTGGLRDSHRAVRNTCRSRSRTFLRSVLRLTPRSSAARIWLPRVAASAAPISGPSISRRMRW